MASFNRVILLGNLTRDPQVRYTPGGTAVSELGLAVNRTWFDQKTNTKREEVTFVDVTLWGRQAEVAGEYLAKGRQVLIEGRLQLDTWDDKGQGRNARSSRVVCENMTMVGGHWTGRRATHRGRKMGAATADGRKGREVADARQQKARPPRRTFRRLPKKGRPKTRFRSRFNVCEPSIKRPVQQSI